MAKLIMTRMICTTILSIVLMSFAYLTIQFDAKVEELSLIAFLGSIFLAIFITLKRFKE